jgi:osmotically-inducible protein OsmY
MDGFGIRRESAVILRRNKTTLLGKLAIGIVALSALAGCAAFQKCGFSACPGDADINTAVEARLIQHPALEPPNLLSVQTHDHIVYLYGLVDTALEREMAESVALATPGVIKVVNSIGISGNR